MSIKTTTTTTTSTEAAPQKHKHGDVIFRPYKSDTDSNFLGYATVYYHDLVINSISVKAVTKNGETCAALTFPGRYRTKKVDGKQEFVLNENGYKIYDEYINPVSKEAREEITAWVEEAVNNAMTE